MLKNVEYIAKFRLGNGAMAMNAIDYYLSSGAIYERRWGMGGECVRVVDSVPDSIPNYVKINLDD